MKNKKGIFDNITIILTLFVVAIFLVFMFFIISKIQPKMSEKLDEHIANQTFNKALNNLKVNFDWISLALLVILTLSLIITSFLFWTNPVFVVIYFLVSPFIIFLSFFISNTFNQIINTNPLNETIESFPITMYIFDHLPFIVLVLIALSAIIIYAKRPTSNDIQI